MKIWNKGGAAGAFSKITGTLGKGLATLSFDKEYQKSRYKHADSSGFGNISQGLVMVKITLLRAFFKISSEYSILFYLQSVVSGVTGVVTKPIEGAKEDGIQGLFKGIFDLVTAKKS